MTDRFVLRLFDVDRSTREAGGLADPAVLRQIAERWKGSPLADGLRFFGSGMRLTPVADAQSVAAAIAKKHPEQFYLADTAKLRDPAGVRWTIGLRRGLVTVLVEFHADDAGLGRAIDALPETNARFRASVPDAADGAAYLSCIEMPGGLTNRALPAVATGRLTWTALADLIDPEHAVHPFEVRLEAALAQGALPIGAAMTDVRGQRLIRWYIEGEDYQVALARRLDWLISLAD